MGSTLTVFAADVDPDLQLLPDISELVTAPIAFALLFFVLWKFAFPRMNAMLEERRSAIQGQMQEAEAARAEVAAIQASQDEELAKARAEAAKIIDDARSQAETVAADVKVKAEAEASQLTTKAREDIEAERGRVLGDLRTQVAALSVELAGQIVGRELDASRHRDLVDSYIDQLSSTQS